MRKLAVMLVVLVMAGACSSYAASTIYGVSGLIETPDDTIVAQKSLALTGHFISGIEDSDNDVITFGGAFGIIPKLEVSAVGVDTDVPGLDTEVLVNAKLRVLDESIERPSVTVGVVDLANQLDDLDSEIDDPSLFVVFGKNISAMAEGISGGVSKPLRGTLGFGTGLYRGIFAGLNWSAAPKFDVLAEFLSNGIRQKSTFNAALRFTPVGAFSVQAGTIGFDDFYVGATFSLGSY